MPMWGALAVGALALSLGCSGTSWEAARSADTVAAYHRFLRDNPESGHATEAEERIGYLRLVKHLSIVGFEEFEAKYPKSSLLEDLRWRVERLYFSRARDANSAAAYQAFLARYPEGELSARARGNLEYVARLSAHPTPAKLEAFLERHPDSDFTADSARTLELMRLFHSSAIDHLWVDVEVAANLPAPERIRRGFASLVAEAYRALGIEVSLLEPGADVPHTAEAWMKVEYHEAAAQGVFGGTMVSQCRVRLYHRDTPEPVWDRSFEAPAEHRGRRTRGRDPTIFGNARYTFWERFFVPLSTWATSLTRVTYREYTDTVVNVDVRGDRAAVLFSNGGVEYLDVSRPSEPEVLGRYRRQNDLSKWDGVRVLPRDRVVVYGSDGVEIVEMKKVRTTRLAHREPSDVGSIKDAAVYDERTLLLVGNKGAWAIRLESPDLMPHRLVQRDYVGLAIRAPFIYLVGKDWIDVATAKQLVRKVTGPSRPLGNEFRARRLRLTDQALFVFGNDTIVQLSLEKADRPTPVAKIDPKELGGVEDLVADAGHLYLVGRRGLQVADRNGEWIADRIQIAASRSVVSRGRFLYLAGGNTFEILDVSPYRQVAPPAAAPAEPPAEAPAEPPAAAPAEAPAEPPAEAEVPASPAP
jgi:hypothetical protein